MSFWVATTVLAAKDKDAQVKTIGRFIKAAKKLWKKYSNFNSLMAVLSGLSIHPIQRLTATWEALSERKLELKNRMSGLMSASSNFKKYRDLLVTLTEARIPYLAVILKDLTLINEGNAKYQETGYINWERIEMIYQQVEAIKRMQSSCEYKFKKKGADDGLRTSLRDLQPITDEPTLYKMSYRFQAKAAGSFDEVDDEVSLKPPASPKKYDSDNSASEESDNSSSPMSDSARVRTKSASNTGGGRKSSSSKGELTHSANRADMLMEIVKKYHEKQAKGSGDEGNEDGDYSNGTKSRQSNADEDDEEELPPLNYIKPSSSSNPNSPRHSHGNNHEIKAAMTASGITSPRFNQLISMKLTTASQNEFDLDKKNESPSKASKKVSSSGERKTRHVKKKSGEDLATKDDDKDKLSPRKKRGRTHSSHSSKSSDEEKKGDRPRHSKKKSGDAEEAAEKEPEPGDGSFNSVSGMDQASANMMKISSFHEGKRRTYYVMKTIDFEAFMGVLGRRHGIDPAELNCCSFTYETTAQEGKVTVSDEESFAAFSSGIQHRGKHSTHIWVVTGLF